MSYGHKNTCHWNIAICPMVIKIPAAGTLRYMQYAFGRFFIPVYGILYPYAIPFAFTGVGRLESNMPVTSISLASELSFPSCPS